MRTLLLLRVVARTLLQGKKQLATRHVHLRAFLDSRTRDVTLFQQKRVAKFYYHPSGCSSEGPERRSSVVWVK